LTPDPFAALASPTRRELLEILRREPGLNAGALADAFPNVTRPAIARHLAVLRRAGLVRPLRHGRESRYYLDAAPIAVVYAEFFRLFVPLVEESLKALKRTVESSDGS
jgi:DNA-binding transcriptional ArsR family regulator